jgi:hypothetical protein
MLVLGNAHSYDQAVRRVIYALPSSVPSYTHVYTVCDSIGFHCKAQPPATATHVTKSCGCKS